jgi:hypothetical protein
MISIGRINHKALDGFDGTSINHLSIGVEVMGLIRAGVAGLAAWKWGGGILGTILLFLLVYWLLGVLF